MKSAGPLCAVATMFACATTAMAQVPASAEQILSNETTLTTWVTALHHVPVHSHAWKRSRVLTRLRFVTGDGASCRPISRFGCGPHHEASGFNYACRCGRMV